MTERSSRSEQDKEDWLNSKWRPAMGWMYMGVCIMDFVVFPIAWSVIQAVGQGQVSLQWQPITLQGAGLFHIAMGTVLGLAAYGRTQEKIVGANNNNYQFPSNLGTTYVPPGAQHNVSVSNYPQGHEAPYQPTYNSAPITYRNGKKAPIIEPDEEI